MEISFYSDVGRVRTNNEDSFLVVPPWREPALSRGVSLFGVADGMGGHACGEVASGLAVATLKKWLTAHGNGELTLAQIEQAFAEANSAIWQLAQSNEAHQGMGTTMTMVFLTATQAYLGHVGDSRGYLLRSGELRQLTRDHTLVGDQIRVGNITPEQAKKHPARHILSRAMGVKEFIATDTVLLDLMVSDILFLCSDGIYDLVEEETLKKILTQTPFHRVAKEVVAEANLAGGVDNATAVALKITSLPVAFPTPMSLSRLQSICSEWWNHFRP